MVRDYDTSDRPVPHFSMIDIDKNPFVYLQAFY